MSQVQTITGPVASADLGRTLSHEHLCSGMAGMERVPGMYDEDAAVERNIAALQRTYEAGICTVVDCTPIDLGRQVSLFERVAGETPMQVVVATGVYRWVPLVYHMWDADYMAEYLLRDLQDGIEGTSIRAGIIKLAWDMEYQLTDGGFRSPREQMAKCARGAARAAKAAGVPITCHTRAVDELGTPLLDIFEDEGLDLRAVTIGHTNDSEDMDYVLGLAARGATVGLDRFFSSEDDYVAKKAGVALALVEGGYAEQACLGHDAAAYSLSGGATDGGPRPFNPECWLLVPDVQVPWLRDHGVSDDNIEALLTRSVRATFEAAAVMAD